VRKRYGGSLSSGGPVAFNGEAGYQARLLMPGLRFKLWPLYTVTRHPMVQSPAGLVGVVIAQVGAPLPIGAKSAAYKPEFGNFQDLDAFVGGGEKGVQRPVLSPGTVAPIHPVGFLVITRDAVFGTPIDERAARRGSLTRRRPRPRRLTAPSRRRCRARSASNGVRRSRALLPTTGGPRRTPAQPRRRYSNTPPVPRSRYFTWSRS
jgi:hypothetical protein